MSKKKVLSIVLSFILVISQLPALVFAEDEELLKQQAVTEEANAEETIGESASEKEKPETVADESVPQAEGQQVEAESEYAEAETAEAAEETEVSDVVEVTEAEEAVEETKAPESVMASKPVEETSLRAVEEKTESVVSWAELYSGILGKTVSTEEGYYDAVTSATEFSSFHAKDIPAIVNRVRDAEGNITSLDGVNLTGAEATVTPVVKSANWATFANANAGKKYGTDELVVYPDDTVEGYVWNEYITKIYAVTVSDGTNTAGAVPWVDFYGEQATSGPHYNKIEIALNSGTVPATPGTEATVHRFDDFYTDGVLNPGNYTVTVYAEGYEPLIAENIKVPTFTDAKVTAADVMNTATSTTVTFEGLPEDYAVSAAVDGTEVSYADGKITYETLTIGKHTLTITDTNGKYNDLTTSFMVNTRSTFARYDGDNALIPADGVSEENFTAYINGITSVTINGKTYNATGRGAVKVISSDGTIDLSKTEFAESADVLKFTVKSSGYPDITFRKGTTTTWADLYGDMGIDAVAEEGFYDAVSSATNFTGFHAKDIPSIVSKVVDAEGITTLTGVKLSGKEATVTPTLQKAEWKSYDTVTNEAKKYGTDEFIVYPDDTVEGYVWNEYIDNVYAVTVSNGEKTVGAVPWIDFYGEQATAGHHYNKVEVALNCSEVNGGKTKASNAQLVKRFDDFYTDGVLNEGTYTVTVYAEGYAPLTAEVVVGYEKSIDDAEVAVDDQMYTGSPLTPVPVVTLDGTALVEGTDYIAEYENNVNAGTATVTITGTGNYTGTKSVDFAINEAPITDASVTGITAKEYTGKALTQNPVVKYKGITLKAGTDYTVSYQNNIKTGTNTAEVIITGKGNYSGKLTKKFTIKVTAPTGTVTILNTVANSSKKTNDVIWNKSAVKGATNYEINWRVNGGTWQKATVGNTTRGTTSNLTIGGLYEIRVRPYKVATGKTTVAYGSWSKSVFRYFYTTKSIRLKSDKKGTFTMSWAKDPKATGYQVLYTTNSNGSGAANNIKTVYGANTTSITVSDIKVNGVTQKLKSGTTYYVQVREIKKVGSVTYIGNISVPVAVKVK